MKVYDLEGNEHEKESIDARECVAIGWTYELKAVEVPKEVEDSTKKRAKK